MQTPTFSKSRKLHSQKSYFNNDGNNDGNMAVKSAKVRGGIMLGVAAAAIAISGCATQSATIDLATYAPVIDVKGQGYDMAVYNNDLDECRMLGLRVQSAYKEQQKREREDAQKSAIFGALAGAFVGSAIGDNNNYHSGRSATAGAVYGGAIGAAVGANNMDYGHTITKFGPTAIVDRCMVDRGYKILSAEGYGGG
jgi:surface antigen